MQIVGGGLTLGLLAFACLAVLHGLANTLDALALGLHRAAASLRTLQDRRTATLSQDWVRTLEGTRIDPSPSQTPKRGRWGD